MARSAGQPLSEEQNRDNRERSRVRSRVEHVFGFQEHSMGGKLVRTIGLARARIKSCAISSYDVKG